VDRTTNGHGYVMEKTFEELRSLDAGQWEKIPSLTEVFDLINKKAKINIELKGIRTAKPVFELIEMYVKTKNRQYDDFLISSFNHYELKEIHELNPKIKIWALVWEILIGFAEFAERLNAYSVHPCIEFINKEFVDDAHARGLKVFVWTVNDPDDIERMKKLGVDGMFSNFPDRL
jgi:glycerophosphoryl diester phosphodiesterase